MANIILIEDQKIFLDALKVLIEKSTEHIVLGTYSDPEEAIANITKLSKKIDLAIIDVRLPKKNGVELTKIIKSKLPDIKVILLSQYPNKVYIKAGVNAGANGYIIKNISSEELTLGINVVLSGKEYYSKDAIKSLSDYSKEEKLNMTLSNREKEVLILIAKGKTMKEVSSQLGIEVSTANYHKDNLKEKLQLKKISDITRYAYESGLMDLGSL